MVRAFCIFISIYILWWIVFWSNHHFLIIETWIHFHIFHLFTEALNKWKKILALLQAGICIVWMHFKQTMQHRHHHHHHHDVMNCAISVYIVYFLSAKSIHSDQNWSERLEQYMNLLHFSIAHNWQLFIFFKKKIIQYIENRNVSRMRILSCVLWNGCSESNISSKLCSNLQIFLRI